jgi:4-diphosphocytidyl-2-C-methyl-D-erythritol kinase
MRIRALAKINLDLRVLHKRPDGYHELRTVFQTVSLADTIDIEVSLARRSTVEIDSAIPDNLIVRAANLVLDTVKTKAHIKFQLKKRIPLGGGLGGGSSDAAAVLLVLPALLGKSIRFEKMTELAAQLGSDVPFFLLGGTAVGAGRGTELYPLPDIPSFPALLVAPGIHVSTADAYAALERELTIGLHSSTISDFQAFVWRVAGRLPGRHWGSVNEFEDVVFPQHPQLESIRAKLWTLGARPALMSGSGSTLFGIFAGREAREKARVRLTKQFREARVYPVSLVSRSAYRALWRRQLASIGEPGLWLPQSQHVVT